MTATISLILAALAAAAWFMSMVAGAFLHGIDNDTVKAKFWYGCSIATVEFLVVGAWLLGRYAPAG